MYGYDSVVKTFLEAGIDVNIRDEGDTKWTALINAAYWDQISCLKILLENGADPDIKGGKDHHRHGWTALMYTASMNYPDLAAELLIKGADQKILNDAGKSATQLAKENNSQDAVQLLKAWGNQEVLNHEMRTAARQGRGRLVSGLLRAGADVETKDKNGETGIDIAVKRGHRAAAEAFLNQGITGYSREECLEQCDENRERIDEANKKMISAAWEGDNQEFMAALEKGAEITSTNRSGDTGLHLGAMQGHQSVVLTLLTRGLDPNIRGEEQRTALMHAAGRGQIFLRMREWSENDHLSCVQTLLEYGALADLKDRNGDTALLIAVKKNYPDIVAELLARQADVNIVNEEKIIALQLAEEENNEDIVKLLEAWGEQETLNKEMLRAASKGEGRLFSGLLRAGADLLTTDEDRRTGLSLLNKGLLVAAKEGSADDINAFIKAGADVQTRDESGETGLYIAMKRGHRAAVKEFLDHGITGYNREECLRQCDKNRERINVANKKMLSAAKCGDNQEVEAAEITSRDWSGDTGLHISADHGQQSVVLTLLTRGLDVNIRKRDYQKTALMEAAEEGHLPCVQTLLDHGALTDLKDNNGDTALMMAAKENHLAIVVELLARQAVINIVNKRGETALKLAELRNNKEVVRILIQSGADLNLRYEDGITALSNAARNGSTSSVCLMMEAGADRMIEDNSNKKALELAQSQGHHEIAVILDRGQTDKDDEVAAKAVHAATEAGCPNVVSDLLKRGANMFTKNDAGETPFQIAARLPKSRKS